MEPGSEEFDYEGLLEKYSNQDETEAETEEKSRLLEETYKDLIKKHQSVLNIYNKKKRNMTKSRAAVTKELNVQACYIEDLKKQQTKLQKLQQEVNFRINDESQLILLNDMKQLSAEYESLDSEFDDATLQRKTGQLQTCIQPIIEEQHKYKNLLEFAKRSAQESESPQQKIDTSALLPLSESITMETGQNFGLCAVLEHGNMKLANTLQNMDALTRNLAELELQLQ